MKDFMVQGNVRMCWWGGRGKGGRGELTFSQRLPQGHLMPVYHHIPKLLLQLFTDAQAVHCMGGGSGQSRGSGLTLRRHLDVKKDVPIVKILKYF